MKEEGKLVNDLALTQNLNDTMDSFLNRTKTTINKSQMSGSFKATNYARYGTIQPERDTKEAILIDQPDESAGRVSPDFFIEKKKEQKKERSDDGKSDSSSEMRLTPSEYRKPTLVFFEDPNAIDNLK